MTTFFTSDWHLGHAKPFVWQARGFPTMESHDKYLVRNWEDNVGRFDHVVIAGDLLMGPDKAKRARELFESLPYSSVTWCLGNHDPKYQVVVDALVGLNVIVVPFGTTFEYMHPSGGLFLVNHLPYEGTDHYVHGSNDRPQLPYPKDKGFPLLHGHTHSQKFIGRSPNGTLMLHVGVDTHAGVVSYQELLNKFETERAR